MFDGVCFLDGVGGVHPKKQTIGPRQIAGGRWCWMVFVFVYGLDGVVSCGGWCGWCLPKKADHGSETDSRWPMLVDGVCVCEWFGWCGVLWCGVVFVFVDGLDGVLCCGGWCLPKKADPGSETDSWWPMVVDGTNTVTGEDRWHRVVTSSEPARAVIPTAFFVCFVSSCFANTYTSPLLEN